MFRDSSTRAWAATVAAGAMLAAAGCQLPVALGGFGVFAGSGIGPDGNGGTLPGPGASPTAKPPGSGGGTVATTGGGIDKGEITVKGKATLDDRQAHAGIEVTLRVGDKSTTNETDEIGIFKFDRIAPGKYTLEARKTGYVTLQGTYNLPEQTIPELKLTSPPVAVELSSATDSVYPPPGPSDFAVYPFRLLVTAKIAKANGDKLEGSSENLIWALTPADQATISSEGLLEAAATARPGVLTVRAVARNWPDVFKSLDIKVQEANSVADLRVLSLRGPGPR
jgi:hypothetical protein